MERTIAFAPNLPFSAAEFVEAWNADPTTRAAAEASLVPAPPQQLDPGLAAVVLVQLGAVAVGLATNSLYDLIKAAVLKKTGTEKPVTVQEAPQADGTTLLIVLIEEG